MRVWVSVQLLYLMSRTIFSALELNALKTWLVLLPCLLALCLQKNNVNDEEGKTKKARRSETHTQMLEELKIHEIPGTEQKIACFVVSWVIGSIPKWSAHPLVPGTKSK